MIDTHIHIYAKEFDNDLDFQIEKAKKAGIQKLLMPNIDEESIDKLHQMENKYHGYCYAMMGLHPCDVKENYNEVLDKMYLLLKSRKYIGVGEIGLDFYWDITFKKEQEIAFVKQLIYSQEFNLPCSIHCRNSIERAIEILKSNELKSYMERHKNKGVFHCFSGTPEQAEFLVNAGFNLGIGGVVTFKNGGLTPVIEKTSLENLVLETDAPYLAPAPHRGKRNEPWMLSLIAFKIAEIKGVVPSKVIDVTTQNANRIFFPE